MASLVGIPPELVGLICSNLSTGDILSLCRSSKGLYAVVHPLLFRHVTISWDQFVAPDEPPNITSLLQFILRNPSYARYIRTLDIPNVVYSACLSWSSSLSNKGSPWQWRPKDAALLKAVIEDFCLPRADEWYTAVVEKADLGAIVALILAQCTHLQSLTVDAIFIPPSNTWLPDVIRGALSAPEAASHLTRFRRLTQVTVPQDDTREMDPKYDPELDPEYNPYLGLDGEPGDDPPEALFLFFYLPRLTTLCFNYAIYGMDRQPWDPTSDGHQGLCWPLADPPLSASLTTLKLDYSKAPASSLEFVLRHTPNLQSLVYESMPPSSSSPLDLTALRQGLDHVRGTLAHLFIRYYEFVFHERPQAPVILGSLGPLDGLAALRDLKIPLWVLLGHVVPETAPPLAGVLPRGLRRLVFYDDLWNHEAFSTWQGEQMEALLNDFFADACKTATPLLEEFVLDMQMEGSVLHDYWADKATRDRLQQLVESQGIKCTIWFYY